MSFWRIWFTATCLGLIGLVTRLEAGVLSLNGTSHVELANPSGVFPIGNDSFTIEAWINPTSIPAGGGSGGQITFWGNQSGNQSNGFRMMGNAGVVHYFWGNDHAVSGLGDMLDDSTGPNGDGWHHVAISYDGDSSQSTWYKDGEVIGAANQTRNPGVNVADTNYRIGSRLNGEFFHGYIDELRIWASARSDSELLSNFDSQINPSSSDLVAYYQFEGADDFSDSTENANDGTPRGVGATVDTGIDSPAQPQLDADEDGIPDFWEEKYGVDDPEGDPDNDGLSNIEEFEARTKPNKADTDEDGLNDGVETGTGTYVSATNTGTDPLNADTDEDGLLDGVETNTGTLVDSDDTGTNPHNRDTDGDGYGDGGEITGGTDPHDPNSKGSVLSPFLYVDFEEGAEDLSENGFNGVVDGAVSFDVDGAPEGPTPRTGASFTGGHIDFPDIDMNSMIRDFEDGSYTFACWLKPIGSAGGQGFMWGQTNQGIHNGIRSGGFLHSAHWGSDWNASTVLEAEEWVHAVWTYDGANDSAAIYLNGQLDGGPTSQNAPNGGGTFLFGARNNGTEQYDGEVDDVAIWREVLPEGMIQALADGASPVGASNADDDEDGLPDYWEEKYGVDDPEGDPDNDGLSNATEYAAKTNPNAEDSDGDGLGDAAEINDHNTDPTSADTDGDGLEDGEEVNGTNGFTSDPNLIDTDNDFVNDFAEAEGGTDPNDPSDPVKKGGVLELDGRVANFVTFNNDSGLIPIGASSFTIEAWINPTSIPDGGGNGGQITFWGNQSGQKANGFRMAGNQGLRHYFWGNDHDANTSEDMLSDTTGLNGDGWHHLALSYDGDTNSSTWFHNGIPVGTKVRSTDPNVDDANYLIGKRLTGEPFHGFIDELRIWNVSRTDEEIVENFEIELSGEENLVSYWNFNTGLTDITGNGHDGIAVGSASINSMLNAPVSSSGSLEITEVAYDLSGDEITITWASRSGRTYALDYSEDLLGWIEIDDGIAADGDLTEFTDVLPPGTMMRFWRVRETDP